MLENATIPSAIVLDLGLPRLSGRDLYHDLRAHLGMQRVPIVIVTGTDITGLPTSSIDCVLQKRVLVATVVDAVDQCVRKSLRQET